jgi:hypothetical protein
MQFPFDKQLAKDLDALKAQLIAKRQSLYAERRECVCDDGGLCAHHADIANHLDEAIRRVDLAMQCTQQEAAE